MVASNAIKEGDILLELDDIHMSFGKVAALAGVSLKVQKRRNPFRHRPQRGRKDGYDELHQRPLPPQTGQHLL